MDMHGFFELTSKVRTLTSDLLQVFGMRLFDDVMELITGGAAQLQAELQAESHDSRSISSTRSIAQAAHNAVKGALKVIQNGIVWSRGNNKAYGQDEVELPSFNTSANVE